MSDYNQAIVPLASYNLKVEPGFPTLAIDEDFPVSIRLTMAALDPTDPNGDEPSTLKIIKRPTDFPEDGLLFDDEDDSEEDDEEEEEEEEAPKEKKGKKIAKKESSDDEEMEDEDSEDSDDESFEIEDYVICTLSPKTGYQQSIDLVITADEDVMFEVIGSYPIHLTGNYIDHPFDGDSSDDEEDFYDSDYDSQDEDDLDGEDYDLTPDEDEVMSGDKIAELEAAESSDEEEEEEAPQPKSKKEKKNKKRASEEDEEEEPKKKQKKNVEFTKELEQGPSGSKKSKKLEGGVTVEDRSVGEGPTAKKGSKVGVRYIGKLADGKVFDSNTKGKPFYFNLGKGEVIKGWETGVMGMAVKGERRIVIPAPMAYGKQKLPGIPANSELTFDVKLVNIK